MTLLARDGPRTSAVFKHLIADRVVASVQRRRPIGAVSAIELVNNGHHLSLLRLNSQNPLCSI